MCIFVAKGGKVDRQQVSIGQRSDLAAEIRQGLKQGDVVSPRLTIPRMLWGRGAFSCTVFCCRPYGTFLPCTYTVETGFIIFRSTLMSLNPAISR